MEANKYDNVLELLNRVHTFLSKLCRDARCDDHCSECIEASDLADDVYDLLHIPRRNCDVGTAEEQADRFGKLCGKHYNEEEQCNEKCPLASLPITHGFPRCQAYWAQTPYAEEGGAK